MMDERSDALRTPPVAASAFRASSGGHSDALRSWERRPFEIPISSASAVSDFASDRRRYVSNVMAQRLDYLNPGFKPKSLEQRNDPVGGGCYYPLMAPPRHDWFLKQWLRTLHKTQADIVRDLDWNKAKVSLTANGKQPYDRDDVNAIADYLNLRPYELLMHPEDAMALRRLRADMVRLAHETQEREPDEPETKKVSMG